MASSVLYSSLSNTLRRKKKERESSSGRFPSKGQLELKANFSDPPLKERLRVITRLWRKRGSLTKRLQGMLLPSVETYTTAVQPHMRMKRNNTTMVMRLARRTIRTPNFSNRFSKPLHRE